MTRRLDDFTPASDHLQSDPTLHWSQKPFATRLIDGGPSRVTLLGNRLKITTGDVVEESPVEPDEWDDVLEHWFGMRSPTAEISE